MPKRTGDFNSWRLEKLADPANAANYLNASLEDSPEVFLEAVKDVIQARKVSTVAQESGRTRESLYRSFSPTGNPRWETLTCVLKSLGLKFSDVEPISASPVAGSPVRSLGQRTTRSVVRGRKRRKGSIPLEQLRFNYEQTSTTPTPQRRLWPAATMTTANIGVNLTLLENQRPAGTIALPPPTERVPVIYPGFYAAHGQHSQPAFTPIQQ